jgi:hypothetical protein
MHFIANDFISIDFIVNAIFATARPLKLRQNRLQQNTCVWKIQNFNLLLNFSNVDVD